MLLLSDNVLWYVAANPCWCALPHEYPQYLQPNVWSLRVLVYRIALAKEDSNTWHVGTLVKKRKKLSNDKKG